LAGGTALALQYGHRQSIDFDYFSETKFSSQDLLVKIKEVFFEYEMQIIQQTENTLDLLVDDVKVSFFHYPYKVLENLVEIDECFMVTGMDIAVMKMSAICSRSVMKDYVDLYYVLKNSDLEYLLSQVKLKFTELDVNVVLKSLTYFDDISDEPIIWEEGFYVNLESVKSLLINKVKQVIRKI
jgi:hypothetical protein